MTKKKIQFIVSNISFFKRRLDQVLLYLLPEYSKSCLKKWIISGKILVNSKIIYTFKENIFLGDEITILIDLIKKEIAENIPLDIIYEDKYLLIINKPSGLVVHPACGNQNGTLLNALLYYNKNLKFIPRAGIVHRLDKNTTGLMIVAKNIVAYYRLLYLLKYKQIVREYEALVLGQLISGGTINYPIMRDKKKRLCMIPNLNGKKSITHYRIIKKLKYYTHVRIRLETGRTHQIRVHMLHIKHPILGDPIYKMRYHIPKGITKKHFNKIKLFSRQALHANKITFFHPITDILIQYNIPLPFDMLHIIKNL